jgi:hypothetical protein
MPYDNSQQSTIQLITDISAVFQPMIRGKKKKRAGTFVLKVGSPPLAA